MSAPQFVHLRVHTAYSLSEGAMLVPKLIHKLHDQGVPAIAVTDTANMFGGKAFSKYASDEGVKPILGCQFYLRNPDADDVLKAKGRIIEPDKIVLLVMNENGYQNIMKLMKRSYLDNPKQGEKAQLKMSDLEELNGGLIALTAGVEGQIGRLLLENRKAEAEEVVVKLREIFADRLYMEISRIGLETEQKTEDDFINFAYKYNIPLVATNEAFFFDADMYEAHDALICIAAGEYVANDDRKNIRLTTVFAARKKWLSCLRICRRLFKARLTLPPVATTCHRRSIRCCLFLNVPRAKRRTSSLPNRPTRG